MSALVCGDCGADGTRSALVPRGYFGVSAMCCADTATCRLRAELRDVTAERDALRVEEMRLRRALADAMLATSALDARTAADIALDPAPVATGPLCTGHVVHDEFTRCPRCDR